MKCKPKFFVAGYGGTDYDEILADLSIANKQAKGIMLRIDFAGGHASGNDKVAKAISQSKRPVFAYTDGMCCQLLTQSLVVQAILEFHLTQQLVA